MSELPATIAAAVRTSSLTPEALVTPVPSPDAPDAGAYAPRSTSAIVFILILATALTALAAFLTRGGTRRERRKH
ncbi:MAG: hypothetical protein F4169_04545 [Gammaproteobacteria bacterium]|nr:hypothetical protein [Gammaproteobacteria bacterium]